MSIKHRHHIIPKHMGGNDSPENLVYLNVEEHALAHKVLWEKFHKWQDEVAWKALSGQISKAEINYRILVESNLGKNNHMYGKISPMRGKIHTKETKQKIKEARSHQIISHSDETKRKIGIAHKGKIISEEQRKIISQSNRTRKNTPRSEESRNKSRESIKNIPKKECPYCGKMCSPGTSKRWHFNNCKEKNDE
jgi:hypothetical protein